MLIKILSLLNILLSVLSLVLLHADCKVGKVSRHKLYITRITLASLVTIFAVICIVNKIMLNDVWVLELMLVLLQPMIVKDAIKYLVHFGTKKKAKKKSS